MHSSQAVDKAKVMADKLRYRPHVLIQSVIIPIVKCKSGNLSDVNYYRAVAKKICLYAFLLNALVKFKSFCSNQTASVCMMLACGLIIMLDA